MANLNTTRIAQDMMGHCMQIYHQHLTQDDNQPHLKIDLFGLGDFDFLDSGPNGSHPYHNENPDGLFFSIIRPQGPPTDNIGIWSTVDYSKWATPTESFLVTASFRDPDRQPLDVKDPFGTFAASILINLDNPAFKYCGVTAQIRLENEFLPRARMNTPGSLVQSQLTWSNDIYEEIVDNQKLFTLILYVRRKDPNSEGIGRLYVKDRLVAETSFMLGNGHNKTNPIKFIMAGLGTASGYYKCSLKMTEFEIFMPLSA